MTSLAGARVLLTGASGGIGQAIAVALAARGARVLLTGRRAEELTALAARLPGADARPCDLVDRAAVELLAAELEPIDVLVANAALPASGRLEGFSAAEIDRALEVNLRAPIRITRALVPGLRARGHGHLLYVGSLAGKAASRGGSIYSATKFGLRGFALALRDELHGTGVEVSLVHPGFVRDAGMFADAEVSLPRGVGTRTAADVAASVVRAIERNHGEAVVAPLGLRLGAALAGLLPVPAAAVQRVLGSDDVSERLAQGQRAKR